MHTCRCGIFLSVLTYALVCNATDQTNTTATDVGDVCHAEASECRVAASRPMADSNGQEKADPISMLQSSLNMKAHFTRSALPHRDSIYSILNSAASEGQPNEISLAGSGTAVAGIYEKITYPKMQCSPGFQPATAAECQVANGYSFVRETEDTWWIAGCYEAYSKKNGMNENTKQVYYNTRNTTAGKGGNRICVKADGAITTMNVSNVLRNRTEPYNASDEIAGNGSVETLTSNATWRNSATQYISDNAALGNVTIQNISTSATSQNSFSNNLTGNFSTTLESLSFKLPKYFISVFIFFVACCATAAFTNYHASFAGEIHMISPDIAEFVGTFCLVFTVGCCKLAEDSSWAAAAAGLVMMVMVYATFPISCGNLNPAVSLSLGLIGKMNWTRVLRYCSLQISAAILASFCLRVLLPQHTLTNELQEPFVWWHGALVETIYTMMMCLVFSICTACKRQNSATDGNQFYGVAIGFALITGGLASSAISGSSLNPAVSLGFELISRDSVGWGFAWSFFQFLGAGFAASIYLSLRLDDFEEDEDFSMYSSPLWAKCTCEFLGTAFLVFTTGLCVITASPAAYLAAAGALICTTYAFKDISGAHFNPCVTLAVMMSRPDKILGSTALVYLVVQFIAGCWAGLLTSVFVGNAVPDEFGGHALSQGHGWFAASLVELFFTLVVAYVVLATGMSSALPTQISRQNFYFALCVGLCYASGSIAVGDLSAGHLNPAVSMGRLLAEFAIGMTGTFSLTWGLLYLILFQIAGGAAASLVYRTTHAAEYNTAPRTILAMSPFIAEFVGAFTVIFTAGCCTLSSFDGKWAPAVVSSMLMCMMYSTVSISGGHLNPAVTLSVALIRDTRQNVILGYCCAQTAAGIVASLFCSSLFLHWHSIGPVGPFSWFEAGIVESIYTFMICFVFSNCWVSKRNNPSHDGNQFFALAIGFVLAAGGYAAGHISGACFNPAMSVGFALAGKDVAWGLLWVIFQVIGALASALLFKVFRPEDINGHHESVPPEPSLSVKCMCEFLGAFLLVFTTGLNLIMMSPAVAFSSAAAMMCMIYALSDISGGHYNPAITLAVMISGRGRCPPGRGLAYMMVQLIAGATAGHLYAIFHAAGPNHDKTYGLEIGAGYDSIGAGAVEMFFTAVIAYTFLSTATVRPPSSQKSSRNAFFGLCVGSCIILSGSAIGKISGALLNPAVGVGISFANFAHSGSILVSSSNCIPVALWQLTGGMIAAVIFSLTHADEYNTSDVGLASAG